MPARAAKPSRVVTAKYPNHVWHMDLTAVTIVPGFWTAWLPFALPQGWPFCWWVIIMPRRRMRLRASSTGSHIFRLNTYIRLFSL